MRIPVLALSSALLLFAPALAAQEPLAVPESEPVPVLVDGWLPPTEWAGAAEIRLGGTMSLLARQVRGHVFLAVASGSTVPRPVDLYLQSESGEIVQLHSSAQIGERRLPAGGWSDTIPAWRWGNHVGWIANETKVDPERARDLPFSQRAFPAEGVEFQILRSRFPGRVWRLRVDVGAFPGSEGPRTYPTAATADPATWAVLELGPTPRG